MEILVYEREPYWAPELRRQFEDCDVAVRHCTSVMDMVTALHDPATTVVVAAIEQNERGCAELLRELPEVFTIMIGSGVVADLEFPFREAGANSFIADHLTGTELSRRIRKVWASSPF